MSKSITVKTTQLIKRTRHKRTLNPKSRKLGSYKQRCANKKCKRLTQTKKYGVIADKYQECEKCHNMMEMPINYQSNPNIPMIPLSPTLSIQLRNECKICGV